MNGIILLYRTTGVEPRLLTKMTMQLFGKVQQSNYGRYKYEVEGMIPKGEYIRPIKAVVIMNEKYLEDAKKIFDAYAIEYRYFQIQLRRNDLKKRDIF